jgi:hypothetical protein
VPSLDTPATTGTTTDVNVELSNQGTPGNLGLILDGNIGFLDLAATARAGIGERSVERLIDLFRGGRRAVTVTAVSGAGFASGSFGLRFWCTLGEGSSLTFGLPACLVEVVAELVDFLLEPLVVLTQPLVVLAELFVVLTQVVELGAEVLKVGQEGGVSGWWRESKKPAMLSWSQSARIRCL